MKISSGRNKNRGANLADTFHHHPKPMKVSLSAVGLFALGLSYAADNNTDGQLPEKWVRGRIIGDDQTAVDQLVSAGMWLREEDGAYQIHDYSDYNLTREELEKRLEPEPTPTGLLPSSTTDFKAWLLHYREVTGRKDVRGSKAAKDQFAARRREGFPLDELKLATLGCHGDDFCRTNGHDVPETILRASKVNRYIQLAKQPKPSPGRNSRLDELVERGRASA